MVTKHSSHSFNNFRHLAELATNIIIKFNKYCVHAIGNYCCKEKKIPKDLFVRKFDREVIVLRIALQNEVKENDCFKKLITLIKEIL